MMCYPIPFIFYKFYGINYIGFEFNFFFFTYLLEDLNFSLEIRSI